MGTYIPIVASIDNIIFGEPNPIILVPSTFGDDVMDTTRLWNTIYVSNPFYPILLGSNMIPSQYWKKLRGTIATANMKRPFWGLIY